MTSAENAVAGRYRFLNLEAARIDHPPDWLTSPGGSKEWTYLLNRFHYLLDVARAYRYTGRDEFVRTGMELVNDWIQKNPVGHPVTWESVSCAWRIENWFAALLHFLPCDLLTEEWTGAAVSSIGEQADYLKHHIEYDLAGNHLLFEAKGLIVAGLMLPELRHAVSWLRDGMELMNREVSRQVLPDGGHGELATHYHVEVTLLLTELSVLLELNDIPLPAGSTDTLRRAYDYLLWITRPDGDIPMLGDSVRDDPIVARRLLGLGCVYLDEPELGVLAQGGAQIDRLLGPGSSERLETSEAPTIKPGSRVFPSSGYVVARSGWSRTSDYLIWDCGPFGMRAGPGHGHADQLSFELVVEGATVVLDPGVYQYEAGPWRDYFRGVTAHNTLRVGGRNPCVMWSAYRVMHAPRTRLVGWVDRPGICVGIAEHDGYRREFGATHRRVIICLTGREWLIADWLYPGTAELPWEGFLHFAPGARLTCEADQFRAEVPGSAAIRGRLMGPVGLRAVESGRVEPIQGWVSYGFGDKLAAPVLRLAGTGMPLPLVTCLQSGAGPRGWRLEDAGGGGVLLRGRTVRGETTIGLRGPCSPLLVHTGLETDAHALLVEHSGGCLSRALLVGGRFLTLDGRPVVQARDRSDFIDWRTETSSAAVEASPGSQFRVDFGAMAPNPGESGACGSGGSASRFVGDADTETRIATEDAEA